MTGERPPSISGDTASITTRPSPLGGRPARKLGHRRGARPRGCARSRGASAWRSRHGRRSARPPGVRSTKGPSWPPVRAIERRPASTGALVRSDCRARSVAWRGRGRVAGIEAEQRDDVGVRRGEAQLRALDIGGRKLGLRAVDGGDRSREMSMPVSVSRSLPAWSRPHGARGDSPIRSRSASARRRRRRPPARSALEALGRDPLGTARRDRRARRGHVVVFREGDRGRDSAQALVLLERPGGLQVPPGEAVEQVVEAGARGRAASSKVQPSVSAAKRQAGRAPWRRRSGRARPRAAPCRRRRSGSPDAETLEPRDIAVPDPGQLGAGRLANGSRVRPDPPRPCASTDRRDRPRRGSRAARFVLDEEVRPLAGETRVIGRVVDDEVGHHAAGRAASAAGAEAADLLVVARRRRGRGSAVEADGSATA